MRGFRLAGAVSAPHKLTFGCSAGDGGGCFWEGRGLAAGAAASPRPPSESSGALGWSFVLLNCEPANISIKKTF